MIIKEEKINILEFLKSSFKFLFFIISAFLFELICRSMRNVISWNIETAIYILPFALEPAVKDAILSLYVGKSIDKEINQALRTFVFVKNLKLEYLVFLQK